METVKMTKQMIDFQKAYGALVNVYLNLEFSRGSEDHKFLQV